MEFTRENPAIKGFQQGSKFWSDQESSDLSNQGKALSNEYETKVMPDKLKQVAGNANTADAAGQVAQRTVEDNVTQERIATSSAGENLRSSRRANDNGEISDSIRMFEFYEKGLEAEGDSIATKLGKNPQDPSFIAIKKDRQLSGVLKRTTQEAKEGFSDPKKQQEYIEWRLKGYREGKPGMGANDVGAGYRTDDPEQPSRSDTPVYGGRGRGGSAPKPIAAEVKRDMLRRVNPGMSEQEATDIALGRKPPSDMDIAKLVEQQIRTEYGAGTGFDTPEQRTAKINRRNELTQELREQFGRNGGGTDPAPIDPNAGENPPPPPGGNAAPAPSSATPAAEPGVLDRVKKWWDGDSAPPAGAQAAPAPAAGGVPWEQTVPSPVPYQQPRNAGSIGTAPAPGSLQTSAPNVSRADPTSGQQVTAGQAATAQNAPGAPGAPGPGGLPTETLPDGRTVVLVQTRQQAEALGPGALFKTPDGRVLRVPASPPAR